MSKLPLYIYDDCPSCNPASIVKTVARFVEKEEGKEELIYECVKCKAKLWVGHEYAMKHTAKNSASEV